MEYEKTWEGKEKCGKVMMRTVYHMNLKGNINMKYRKKPVVVAAMQYDGENLDEILKYFPIIRWSKLSPNIWVVHGEQGGYSLWDDDVFKETYEKVEEI